MPLACSLVIPLGKGTACAKVRTCDSLVALLNRNTANAIMLSWRGSPCNLPMPILCKHVISILDDGVASDPAFGIVPLRRTVSRRSGREGVRCGVIPENRITPSAIVRETLAVLHHEVNVVLN